LECPQKVRPESVGKQKELHRILKQGTKNAALSWFAIGDYKKRANVVGGRETAAPREVPARMNALLSAYESLHSVSIHDVIRFHHDFEHLHPFQDGNGRVGRLIALKECLRHAIVPFIIEDAKKCFITGGCPNGSEKKAI